ncbi:MAG: ABC transporter permease [Actinomycetota bacterium]
MIGVEFRKQTRRLRTYIGLGICAGLPIIITIALKVGGPPRGRGDQEAGFFRLATKSGINMPIAALSAMSMFLLPVVIMLFFGESVAGEAAWGTLRYVLVRPVKRARLLTAKVAVASVLAVVGTAIVVLVGLAAGVAAFGWHPVATPTFVTFPPGAAVARLTVAAGYVVWSFSGAAAFAFALSTMTDVPVGAVAGSMGFVIVSQILDGITAIPEGFRNWLPTHFWRAWDGLFTKPSQMSDMIRGTLHQLPYVVGFAVLAWWWFARKDIMS